MNLLTQYGEDQRKMTGVISTTFTFNVNFYENIILKQLSKKGIMKNNVVLLDSSQYNQTFNFEEINKILSAGVDYYLEPISVGGKKVFHPKIYFFSGERRVYAFVGSANLTQKGFTYNGELFTSFSYEKQDQDYKKQLVPIKSIRDFLIDLLNSEYSNLVSEISREIVFHRILNSCEWIDDVDINGIEPDTYILNNFKNAIFDQMLDFIDGDIQKSILISPYFGETTHLLERISSKGDFEIELFLQQNRAQFDSDMLQKWLKKSVLTQLNIFESSRFIHGKLLLIKTKTNSYCLTGSPNLTFSAMLRSVNDGGNIEVAVLRIEDNPDYFDYLIQDSIVNNIISHNADEFISTQSSLLDRSVKGLEDFDLKLLDAFYKRRTSFTGGNLTIVISNIINLEGKVKVDGLNESFKLNIKDGKRELIDKNKNASKINFSITSEKHEEILSNSCQICVKIEDKESNRRWLACKSPESEEAIDEGVKSGATSNIPNRIPDFLFGEDDLRMKIFNTVGQIIKKIYKKDRERVSESGNRRRSLPPDWGDSSYTTPKTLDDILDYLYNIWINQMKELSADINNVDSESLIKKFSRYIHAINKTTGHLLIIYNNYNSLKFKTDVNLNKFSRNGFKKTYGSDDSVIKLFITHLIKESIKMENENVENTYKELQKSILPKIIISSLLINEDEDFLEFYEGIFVKGASYCFYYNHPLPNNLSPEFKGHVINSVKEFFDDLISRYEDKSKLYNSIKLHYSDDKIKKEVNNIYADLILTEGPSGIKRFYRQLKPLLKKNELGNKHKTLITRLSAKISNRMEKIDSTLQKSIVNELQNIQEEWIDMGDRDKRIIEYAFPTNLK